MKTLIAPISVHILTKDSGSTVERALQSVTFCAERLVIDGGSTDSTLAIAAQYDAHVIAQPAAALENGRISDFAAVRNEALKHSTQPWILVLDSDEWASLELQSEIARIAATATPGAYFIPRKYVTLGGKTVDWASTYPNEHLFFFHRDAVGSWVKPVHERIEILPGMPVGHLHGASMTSLSTLEDYTRKNLQYLRIEAAKDAGKGWGFWLGRRVLPIIRSRCISLVRLAGIWLIPRKGTRLPLSHEWMRFWYGWKLIVVTCPLSRRTR